MCLHRFPNSNSSGQYPRRSAKPGLANLKIRNYSLYWRKICGKIIHFVVNEKGLKRYRQGVLAWARERVNLPKQSTDSRMIASANIVR
jgi:hypothetical protein